MQKEKKKKNEGKKKLRENDQYKIKKNYYRPLNKTSNVSSL